MFVFRLVHFFLNDKKKKPILRMTSDEKIWAIHAGRDTTGPKYFDVELPE